MKIILPIVSLFVGAVAALAFSLLVLQPPAPAGAAPEPRLAELEAKLAAAEKDKAKLAERLQTAEQQLALAQARLDDERARAAEAAQAAESAPATDAVAIEAAAEENDRDDRDGRGGRRGGWQDEAEVEDLTPEQILGLLASEEPRDKMRGLRALHLLPDQAQAYALALEALNTKDAPPWVAYQAMQALVKIDPVRAVEALAPLTLGEDMRLATVALRQLGEIESPLAADALRGALASSSDRVRLEAAMALKERGDSSGVTQIANDLMDDLSNQDGAVRESAVRTLSTLSDPAYNPQLVLSLQDSNSAVRRSAAEALSITGTTADLPALQALASDPQANVQRAAERAIRLIENPEERERARRGPGSFRDGGGFDRGGRGNRGERGLGGR